MEIEIGVLVELEAAGHLLPVPLVLHRLQRHGMMRKLRRAFV